LTENNNPADNKDSGSGSSGNRKNGIFSSSKSVMDYVMLSGIRNRVGVDTEADLITYAVKELLDNALEFIERNASKRKSVSVKPYIDVSVTKAPLDNYVTIIIRNSNFGISNSFSNKDVLKSVFD
jgi:signal transduction histidine kinase